MGTVPKDTTVSTGIGARLPDTSRKTLCFSRKRLQRIYEAIQKDIDPHDISGAVTLVMRRGRVEHRPPSARPLMLTKEGKLRLKDRISRAQRPQSSRSARLRSRGFTSIDSSVLRGTG